MTQMVSAFAPGNLVRWTAASLLLATVFFAAAIVVEGSNSEQHAVAAPTVHTEAAADNDADAPVSVHAEGIPEGEAAEAASHESGDHGAAGHSDQVVLGINLENPWITWGFVATSLILAVAVLRLGRPALIVAAVVAGGAATLDANEAILANANANVTLAAVALLSAIAHAAVVVFAIAAFVALLRSAARTTG